MICGDILNHNLFLLILKCTVGAVQFTDEITNNK